MPLESPLPLSYPLKIVSDLHYRIIGGRLKRPGDLRPIFSGFKTIILNGDSVEQLLYGTIRADQHKDEMLAVARELGAKLIFLRGNHDPEMGAAEFSFELRKKRVRIAHGDFGLIQFSTSPRSALHRAIPYLWYTFRTLKSYPVYWRQVPMAMRTMRENEIFILGHTHQPSLTRSGSKVVVNLGAHMRGFSNAWVEVGTEHGEIVLCGKSRNVIE
jgi:predicted phosphodiesterase